MGTEIDDEQVEVMHYQGDYLGVLVQGIDRVWELERAEYRGWEVVWAE